MNRQKSTLLVVALLLIGGSGGVLAHFHTHQKLAPPGVKTQPVAGSNRLRVELPEQVLDYKSEWVDPDKETLGTLPQDTSFGERIYKGPDDFQVQATVVLMGTDRTSLHKPQFCLEGQGYRIDPSVSQTTHVTVERPQPYELPIVELVSTKDEDVDGQRQTVRGIYVYWYVASDALSASTSGFERMKMMASKLLLTGVLQRWAYVSCFSRCAPGQEQATFERMKKFITAAVPEFQLYPAPGVTTASAKP